MARLNKRAPASTPRPPEPGPPLSGQDPVCRKRFARLRERWRNASLKTSFMVYMLGFLLAAFVLSSLTAVIFADLQNRVTEDAYELTGLYLYDADDDALIPARLVEVSTEGNTMFVQTVRDGLASLARTDLSANTNVREASDYSYVSTPYDSLSSSSEDESPEEESSAQEGETPPTPEELTVESLPSYDTWARSQFESWLASHPESPYHAFFTAGGATSSDNTTGLLTSAVGYYLSTPPSAGASALSALFGLLTFLMFPLWFGLCIFAAARRFFRMRLAPGLATLDDAAGKIARQDLDFTVHPYRDDELGRLAQSFEAMRASLEASQRELWRTAEERKRLNAAFAHDLRTPLTILKGKVELLNARLQTGVASPEQLQASVNSLASQVERLEHYVAAMSGLQKLEDRHVETSVQPFDAVAGAVEDIGTGLAAPSGAAFTLSVSARCDRERPPLGVDRAVVEEVAENLIGNAARFAAERVEVRMDVHDGYLLLIVEDDGAGFSAAALERGCAPFFSETPSKDHFGLGLNIAALLCDKHGGSLVLENRPEGGARATARFASIFPAVDRR